MRKRAAIIRLMQFFSMGINLPVLTLIFLQRGLTLSQVSLIFACFSIATIALEVPTGVFADLAGRKRTFIISALLSALAYIVVLFGNSLPILFIGAILLGSGRAFSSGSIDALFIEQHTEQYGVSQMPRIISLFAVTEAIGLAIGSLLGGLLPALASRFLETPARYNLNLLTAFACQISLAVLVALTVNENHVRSHSVSIKSHILASIGMVRRSRNLLCIFATLAAAGIFLNAIELFWQPKFVEILKNDTLIWLLGVVAVLYFGSVLAGSKISEIIFSKSEIKYKIIFSASRIGSGIALLLLAFQQSPITFIALYMLIYLFIGISNIPEGTLINMEIPDDKRASILSLNSLVLQLGGLLGALAGAIAVEIWNISIYWIIAAAIIILSAIFGLKIKENARTITSDISK